jgi:hypothetical protein
VWRPSTRRWASPIRKSSADFAARGCSRDAIVNVASSRNPADFLQAVRGCSTWKLFAAREPTTTKQQNNKLRDLEGCFRLRRRQFFQPGTFSKSCTTSTKTLK